jgi:hypothetical protein
VGCIRGLKVGETLIDLAEMAQLNSAHVTEGVLPSCQMKCDAEPCKNGGICTEKFSTQESTCNCEHTSFLGEFCMEEKGADFSGESILQRKFIPSGSVEEVKLQLAFSSNDLRRAARVMFLLQTENEKSYYMMVGITVDGYLQFEEDREGATFGATIERNFLNHARHSVYYKRKGENATLLIDREDVAIEPMPVRQHVYRAPSVEFGANEVQIGGINSTDPRFAVYKSYSGCLSSKEYKTFDVCDRDDCLLVFFQTYSLKSTVTQ